MGSEPQHRPRIAGVGTAVSGAAYTQQDLLRRYQISDPKIRSVFANSGIDRRYLCLPEPATGPEDESQSALLEKHRDHGLALGVGAVEACLKRIGRVSADIGHLCCVTSTGFLMPGFSALLSDRLCLPVGSRRLDVVGMGCNAALNALDAVAGWSLANPHQLAVLVCVEVASAAYVMDGTTGTAVVNSLFGDGAGALAVTTGPSDGLEILGFASTLVPHSLAAMRYDWDDAQGKFSFSLHREVPYVIGAHCEAVVDRLLDVAGLRRSDITHWIIHSGGRKVIDSVRVNLRLSRHDVRHTRGVLRDFGNLSSGSAIFSFERLVEEDVAAPGDFGVLMTMGPGSSIETALVRW